jgi:ABC-type amino acid transport system permease subunit
VLGATNYLSDLVPGLTTAPFVGLSLAYGGTVIAAPVVYYAFSRQQPDPSKPNTNATVTIGSGRGLTALMVITLFGIYGELASLALLVHESNRPWFETTPLLVGILAAALTAGTYAVRSTRDTINFAINNQKPALLSGAAL